jgi:glycosyltransferase involved in cell wall biosynthesis
MLWNRQSAAEVTKLIHHERPDVLHCTNTFPLISPSVCHAANRAGVAVVQALQNYRLLCAGAYLMRDGKPCEDCIGRMIPWPAIVNRCYHNSTAASAGVAAMQMLHRTIGTWRRKVDAFFTPTAFGRSKFIQAGFPAERMHVKYNSVDPDPGVGNGSGNYVAFAGRLSPEKGLATLLEAWRGDARLPQLKIAGDGPLLETVRLAAANDSRIECLGRLSESEVYRVVGSAAALLVPSVWYEGFPKTIIEAYAKGTPVVASRLGSMAEVVHDGISGTSFVPGDATELAAAVHRTIDSPTRLARMRVAARGLFENRYTATASYERLIEIYNAAIRAHHGNDRGTPDSYEPVACISQNPLTTSISEIASEPVEPCTV